MVSPVNASWWRDQVTDNMTHHDPAYYGAHYDVEETPGTTHLSVVGPDGTAVGVTSTVNLHWGSKVMTRHGVLLNNEMDDFASPGISNAFGVEPSESNFIRPGRPERVGGRCLLTLAAISCAFLSIPPPIITRPTTSLWLCDRPSHGAARCREAPLVFQRAIHRR